MVVDSFAQLSALIDNGSVKMIELQAVPRSLSTALGRCLNETDSPSVFLNEPFRQVPPAGRTADPGPTITPDPWSHNDVDVAAGHVIRIVESAPPPPSGPVIVVSKNMAQYLSAPVLRTWTDMCSAVVWCVRDPRIQIASFVTRLANDLLFGIGSDRLDQGDLSPSHWATVTKFLQDSPWSTDFSKSGWGPIGEHFTDCAGRLPNFVADGSLLGSVPDRFLRYLCDGLGIEYNDHMIAGWRQPFLSVDMLYDPELPNPDNAWIKRAATASGVEATERAPLDVSMLPDPLRRHVVEVAMPTYEMFMRVFYAQETLAQYCLDPDNCPAQ